MNKMYNSVKQFSETAPKLSTAFRDYYNHTMALERKDNLYFSTLQFSKERSLEEKETVINKLFAEELVKRSKYTVDDFNGSMERYALSPTIKQFADSMADFLIDMVLPETLMNGVIGYFTDFKFGGFGDVGRFEIENNALFSVSQAGRRQRTMPAQRLEKGTATLAAINHEITVITNLPNILAGRDSIAKHIMKAVRSIETKMLYEGYDAFKSNVDSLVAPLKVASYAEKDVITACQRVTAYNQGRKAIILGTPVALKSVLPDNTNMRFFLDSPYVTAGNIPVFNGYDVIPLAQVADYENMDKYGLKLKDDELYIISPASQKIMQCFVEGDSISHTSGTYDRADLSQVGTISKAWGFGCITNSIMAVVKLV